MYTVDDLVRQRAADADQSPLLAFPRSQEHPIEYEYFTGKTLNQLVDGAVKSLIKSGVKPVVSVQLHPTLAETRAEAEVKRSTRTTSLRCSGHPI